MAIARAWSEEPDEELHPMKKGIPNDRKQNAQPITDAHPPASGYKSKGTTQDVALLKQMLIELATKSEFVIDSVQFPWKGLRHLLAKTGFYLTGWAAAARMPGEKGTEKGITGLRAHEQTAVFASIVDKDFPLMFVRYDGNIRGKLNKIPPLSNRKTYLLSDLIDGEVPVVLGAPSDGSRGRRLFVNGQIDNKGIKGPPSLKSKPPTMKATRSVATRPATTKRARSKKCEEVQATTPELSELTSDAESSSEVHSRGPMPISARKTVEFATEAKGWSTEEEMSDSEMLAPPSPRKTRKRVRWSTEEVTSDKEILAPPSPRKTRKRAREEGNIEETGHGKRARDVGGKMRKGQGVNLREDSGGSDKVSKGQPGGSAKGSVGQPGGLGEDSGGSDGVSMGQLGGSARGSVERPGGLGEDSGGSDGVPTGQLGGSARGSVERPGGLGEGSGGGSAMRTGSAGEGLTMQPWGGLTRQPGGGLTRQPGGSGGGLAMTHRESVAGSTGKLPHIPPLIAER
jgi:hypothetical protein